MEGLINSLSSLPANVRWSITFDRGTEFTAWQYLKDGLGVDPWFCDPQSPWQKGTVENTNNRLRRYLPRKVDPTAFTDRYLRSICDRLNATPRKCLGYQTHAEVFRAKLMKGRRHPDKLTKQKLRFSASSHHPDLQLLNDNSLGVWTTRGSWCCRGGVDATRGTVYPANMCHQPLTVSKSLTTRF